MAQAAAPRVSYAVSSAATPAPVTYSTTAGTYVMPPVTVGSTMPAAVNGFAAAPAQVTTQTTAVNAAFNAIDRNQDGVITKSEFGYALTGAPVAGQVRAMPAAPQIGGLPGAPGGAGGFPFGQASLAEAAVGGLPPPPKRQTDAMPSPQSVEQQKLAYARALETQLEAGKRTIAEQTTQAKGILAQAAEEKKMQYEMQIEEQLMQQMMALDQQTHQQVMQLHQAAFQQKAQLEQQASNLTMEYKQRQMQETMQQKQYEMQNRQYEVRMGMQKALRDKMNSQVAAGGPEPNAAMAAAFNSMDMNHDGFISKSEFAAAMGGAGPSTGPAACGFGVPGYGPPPTSPQMYGQMPGTYQPPPDTMHQPQGPVA